MQISNLGGTVLRVGLRAHTSDAWRLYEVPVHAKRSGNVLRFYDLGWYMFSIRLSGEYVQKDGTFVLIGNDTVLSSENFRLVQEHWREISGLAQ